MFVIAMNKIVFYFFFQVEFYRNKLLKLEKVNAVSFRFILSTINKMISLINFTLPRINVNSYLVLKPILYF